MLCACTNCQLIRDRDIPVQVLAIPNCNDWLHIPDLSPLKWTENAEHLEKYCRNKTFGTGEKVQKQGHKKESSFKMSF